MEAKVKWQRMTSRKYAELNMVTYYSGKFININDNYSFGLLRIDGTSHMVLIEKDELEYENKYNILGYSGSLPIIEKRK